MPHEIIYVFIWFFIGAILSKNFDQKQGFQKKDKKEGWSFSGLGGVSIEGSGSEHLRTLH